MKANKFFLILIIIITILNLISGCDNWFFSTREYSLTVNQTVGGTVELDPQQSEYEKNTEVKITAVPDKDWKFVEWLGSLESEENDEIIIIVEQDLIIEAKFQKLTVKGHISLINKIDEDGDNNGGGGRSFSVSNIPEKQAEKEIDYVEDEIIVKFKADNDKQDILNKHQLHKKSSGAFGTIIVSGVGQRNIKDLINKLNKNPNIEYAELNKIYSVFIEPVIPENADSYDQQKAHYSLISLPYAWSITTGSNQITVAVLDTGVDSDHPDLRDNMLNGRNFTDDGSIYDTHDNSEHGHGTHVAGTIGAINNEQVAGVSWQINLIPVKVLSGEGNGKLSDIAEGIEWAIDETDADIINMSLGAPGGSTSLKKAVERAYNAGITIIAAAGNTGDENNGYQVNYPAAYQEVIAVGSVNYNMKRSDFSSYGDNLDFMAPGEAIYSTVPDGEYGIRSGTSMAAPHVAGVAALMLSLEPDLDPAQIKEKLKITAQDLGDDQGKDYEYGYGLINSHAAVKMVENKADIKIFAGLKDEEENIIDLKSKITNPDQEGFYNLEKLDDQYYIYGWLDLTGTGQISSGDYFGKSSDRIQEDEKVDFQLDLITAADEFEPLTINK